MNRYCLIPKRDNRNAACLLMFFLLITFRLYAQKQENEHLKLIQGTWVCNENKDLVYIIKNDSITDIYLDPYFCSMSYFRIVKELLYEDKKITTSESETLLIIYNDTTGVNEVTEQDKIQEIYFIESLDEKRLTLMAYNNLQIVTFKKTKKKILPKHQK